MCLLSISPSCLSAPPRKETPPGPQIHSPTCEKKKKQESMVRAKNVRFWMNASKAEVRASLGGTDEEWEIFAVTSPPPYPLLSTSLATFPPAFLPYNSPADPANSGRSLRRIRLSPRLLRPRASMVLTRPARTLPIHHAAPSALRANEDQMGLIRSRMEVAQPAPIGNQVA